MLSLSSGAVVILLASVLNSLTYWGKQFQVARSVLSAAASNSGSSDVWLSLTQGQLVVKAQQQPCCTDNLHVNGLYGRHTLMEGLVLLNVYKPRSYHRLWQCLTVIAPDLAKIKKLSQQCIRNSSSSSGKQAAYSERLVFPPSGWCFRFCFWTGERFASVIRKLKIHLLLL